MSLKQLIDKCIKHDTKAQGELYQLYAGKLFSLCLKYSNTNGDAEDILHDAFMTIFNKIDQYTYKGSFEGWMKRITINTALQRYRGSGVFELVKDDQITDSLVDIDDSNIDIDYLLRIIQQLPDRYRLVFNLYVLDGYSHREISELLEISEGTSKSNLSRARMILKDKIEEYKTDLNSQSL